MFNEITDEFIIKVLSSGDELTDEISKIIRQKQMELINQKNSVSIKNDLIRAASLPGRKSDIPGASEGVHDLQRVLDDYERLNREQIRYIASYLDKLNEQLETINRIKICIELLDDVEKTVVTTIYHHRKFVDGVEELNLRYGYSKTTAMRYRKSALTHIKNLYNSSNSNIQLINKL